MSTQRQVGVDPQLQRRGAQLLQPDAITTREVVVEVLQRRPPPQAERLPQRHRRRLGRPVAQQPTALIDEPIEADRVDDLRRQHRGDSPTPSSRSADRPSTGRRGQRSTHLAHQHLHGVQRITDLLVPPQLLDDPTGRHHLARPQTRAAPATPSASFPEPRPHCPSSSSDLERSQQPKLHPPEPNHGRPMACLVRRRHSSVQSPHRRPVRSSSRAKQLASLRVLRRRRIHQL